MQYSPKLKMAINEMRGILSKHDIAGLIVLHTPGHSEYLLKIDPSYSCAKLEGDGVRLQAKKKDFPTIEAWTKRVSDTSNMLNLLFEVGGHNVMGLSNVSDTLDNIVGAEHTEGGHTTETTQNN